LCLGPLIVVSNSNPDVLRVEKLSKTDTLESYERFQKVSMTLTPTGTNMGVSTIVIRASIISLQCKTPTSITFTVQIHRPPGKRLHAVYPAPVCRLPPSKGGIVRPWVHDSNDCIPYQDILDGNEAALNEKDPAKTYTKLPVFFKQMKMRLLYYIRLVYSNY